MSTHGLDLLEQYTRHGVEEAFAALVRQNVDLVYSAALRTVRSPQLAEEVAQSVFTDLARQAHKMKPDTLLSAWLYRVTRRTAIDVVRRESRRQQREQVAVELARQDSAAPSEWTDAEPLLDEAMEALPEADRNAVLLRFFEGKDLRAVGGVLGVSEEAARKRVARAVERLREFLSRRGVEVTSVGVVALLSAKAVEAAPAGLAAAITAALPISGAVLGGAAALQFTKAVALTTVQKVALAAAVIAAVGTGVYQAHRVSQLGREIETLQEQQEPLAAQINALTDERDRLAASLQAVQAQHRADVADLPKLRAEVARLRNDSRELAQLKAQAAAAPRTAAPAGPGSEALAAKIALLRRKLDQMPNLRIPELQFAKEEDWLQAAKRVATDSDEDVRKGLSLLRTLAKEEVAPMLVAALQGYVTANKGEPPATMVQLKPFLQAPLDDAILDRYELALAGNMSPGAYDPDKPILREKADARIDDTYDPMYWMSLKGSGGGGGPGVVLPEGPGQGFRRGTKVTSPGNAASQAVTNTNQ